MSTPWPRDAGRAEESGALGSEPPPVDVFCRGDLRTPSNVGRERAHGLRLGRAFARVAGPTRAAGLP